MKIVNKLWVQPVFNISRHNENVMYETELILDSLMNSLLLCALVGCIWNKWAWQMCRIWIFRWLASLRSCWGFGLNGHQGREVSILWELLKSLCIHADLVGSVITVVFKQSAECLLNITSTYTEILMCRSFSFLTNDNTSWGRFTTCPLYPYWPCGSL